MDMIVLIKPQVNQNADITPEEYLPEEFDKDDIVMNPNDKHAVEAALQIKEAHGGTVKVLSLGPEDAALKVVREAIAMGADEGAVIETEELGWMDTLTKANILVKGINKLGSFDLLLTGMYSTDFTDHQIPQMIAELLNLPAETYISEYTIEEGKIKVHRYIEGGTVELRIPLPAVLSIASVANEPRYTPIKRIMLARRTKIPIWELDDLELDEDEVKEEMPLKLVGVSEPPAEERELIKIEEEDPEKAVDLLLEALKKDGIDLGAYKK